MGDIVQSIKQIDGVYTANGCSDAQIIDAETKLGIKFPLEFTAYVKEFGAFGFGSIEWAGLNVSKHLNTVDLTLEERKLNSHFPSDMFVLENLGIDGLLICADSDGAVWEICGDKKNYVCASLGDYLETCINQK